MTLARIPCIRVLQNGRQGGGAQKKFAVSPFFGTSPPKGAVRPKKKFPPLCVPKFCNPIFSMNTISCLFILCKCSLHNASRSPNIPHFAGTNLVALPFRIGPKFSHHKARVLAGVKSAKTTFQFSRNSSNSTGSKLAVA